MSVRVSLDNEGHIDLKANGHFVYSIDIEQAKRDHLSGRLDWSFHLSQKIWFTKQMAFELGKIFERVGIPEFAAELDTSWMFDDFPDGAA